MRTLGVGLTFVVVMIGCGTDQSGETDGGIGTDTGNPVGSERGPCYPNGTCNGGLTCASGLCVRLTSDSGPPDSSVDAPQPDGGNTHDSTTDAPQPLDGKTQQDGAADTAAGDSEAHDSAVPLDVVNVDGPVQDSSSDSAILDAAPLPDVLSPDTQASGSSVTVTKIGVGTVLSTPPGINCGSVCSTTFPAGSTVVLEGQSDQSSSFVSWSGDCAGFKTCSLAINSNKNVVANFAQPGVPKWTSIFDMADLHLHPTFVTADDQGNAYLAGYFHNTVTLCGVNLTAIGNLDAFLVKYKADGSCDWYKRWGDTNTYAEPGGIGLSSGNVSVMGRFTKAQSFGGPVLSPGLFKTTYSASGVYVDSVRADGDVAWPSCTIDANGNWAVTGMVNTTGGIYLAKYLSTGQRLWYKVFKNNYSVIGEGVGIDSSGNVLMLAKFSGTLDFGKGSITATSNDIVVAKYTTSGNATWVKHGPVGFAGGIAVDGDDNVVATGSYSGTFSLDGKSITSKGLNDIFLAKFSANAGTVMWLKGWGAGGHDYGRAVVTFWDNSVAVTGSALGPLDLGGGMQATQKQDTFLAKYKSDGSYLWSRFVGGADNGDEGWTIGGVDRVVVAGRINGLLPYGQDPPSQAFIASFGP